MRGWLIRGTILLLIVVPSPVRAQDIAGIRVGDLRQFEAVRSRLPAKTTAAPSVTDPVRRLKERLQPLRDRLVEDDRLRMASGLIGLGVVAYEARHAGSHPPLMLIGAEALRVGLRRPLAIIGERTGYDVEAAVGRRRIVVTFRPRSPGE